MSNKNDEPHDAKTWFNLGLDYEDQKRYDEAEKAYKTALELDASHSVVWYNLGIIYQDQERYDEAEKAYKKVLELDASNSDVWLNLGTAFQEQKRYEEAEKAYKKALELDASDSTVWYNLACLYVVTDKNKGKFLEYLSKAIDLNNDLKLMTKTDPDFEIVKNNPRFKDLVSD